MLVVSYICNYYITFIHNYSYYWHNYSKEVIEFSFNLFLFSFVMFPAFENILSERIPVLHNISVHCL